MIQISLHIHVRKGLNIYMYICMYMYIGIGKHQRGKICQKASMRNVLSYQKRMLKERRKRRRKTFVCKHQVGNQTSSTTRIIARYQACHATYQL